MFGFYYKCRNKLFSIITKLYIENRYINCRLGKGFKTDAIFHLSLNNYSTLIIGEECNFVSRTSTNFVGINKNVSICVENNAKLIIGNNCGFSGTSIYCSFNIKIGSFCNFGGNTFIWDTDFHPLNFMDRREHNNKKISKKSIIIGNDVFVGANSIILKGVKIGDRVVIGAGSVITKNIPSDEVWAGNPAKFIKKV